MKNQYIGVTQTPRKNKFNIMEWIEQPKLIPEKTQKKQIVKEGVSEGQSVHELTSVMSDEDDENAEGHETEEQRKEKV